MTPLKNLTDDTLSNKANADRLGMHPEQLKRWLNNDAHFDQEGNVYIRTKGKLPSCTATGQSSQPKN